MDENKIQKIDYLKFAINDAQELIRFYDSKTSIAILILGGMWAYFITYLPEIIKFTSNTYLYYINPSLLSINIIFTSILIYRIIFPVKDPSKHINYENLTDDEQLLLKNNLFFIPNNKNKKLDSKLKKYLADFESISENDLIFILSNELHKVSFIRNQKHSRFKSMAKWLLILTFHFIIFLTIHHYFKIYFCL